MSMSSLFFFFKQKTAYEISACLVGSEMCIRDSFQLIHFIGWKYHESQAKPKKRGSAEFSLKDLHKEMGIYDPEGAKKSQIGEIVVSDDEADEVVKEKKDK
eukprot:TRINITY_DN5780_c0_g1_i8.p2 TRINITY_DN5780_c0_g1~~TRINITY_DN5780_c0_g1_i8.p2  ORF type:complete len:101 (+),score=37.37 TRINITY_DN5780_c0_g1_i8:17-319(+)